MKNGKPTSRQLSTKFDNIDITLIDPPGDKARMDISEREVFELSESFKSVGQIQAIILVPRGERFEVVAGHRRFLAAQHIGWGKIKAEVRKLSDKDVAIIRMIENLQRVDISPIEEAVQYSNLFDNHKFTMRMIADQVGKSANHIKVRMELLKLDPQVQKAIHERKISIGVARALSRIEDKKDLYRYLDIAIENGVTETVAKMWTEEYRKSLRYIDTREEPPDLAPDLVREEKYYTMCQACEGAMEYKDMRSLKVCSTCYELLVKVISQGHFKKGGE